MTLTQLDFYFKNLLKISDFSKADPSQNGIQVQNNVANFTKIAFAVDASLETFKRASEVGAQMIFVHHGLFWGNSQTITGIHYDKITFLIANNIALYACHLPLDAHPDFGNNATLASALNLENREPFGEWHGKLIGIKGTLQNTLTPEQVMNKLFPERRNILSLLPFGKKEVSTIGIISGGAWEDVYQAIDQKLDMYITGEVSHEIYHPVKEAGINFLAGGHYQTETGGVKAVASQLGRETGIETIFLDIPTNL